MIDNESSTPMGWKLFLVDRPLTNQEISSTFAQIFNLEPADILIIEADTEIDEDLPENIAIVCERSPAKGEFNLSLSIYPQDEELEEIVTEIGGEIETIVRFTDILKCKCLIIDPSPEHLNDEDACLLLTADTAIITEVYLDSESLENDEYIVVNSSDSDLKLVGRYLLNENIYWVATNDAEIPYQAKFDNLDLKLRLNDFPEEDMYTLIINSVPSDQLNDLPISWQLP